MTLPFRQKVHDEYGKRPDGLEMRPQLIQFCPVDFHAETLLNAAGNIKRFDGLQPKPLAE